MPPTKPQPTQYSVPARAPLCGLVWMLATGCAAGGQDPSMLDDPGPSTAAKAPTPAARADAGATSAPTSQPSEPDAGGPSTEAPDAAAQNRAELRALIMGIPALPTALAQQPTEVLPAKEETDVRDGTLMQCTYRRFTGTQVYDSLVSFDPNADSLWPGSVVQSRNLNEGMLAPIALRRAPGTVTISNAIIGGNTGYSRVVAEPTQASVQAAISDILRANKVNLAAKADYVAEQVHSLTEAALKVGVAVDWMTGAVKGSFDGDWKRSRSSFVVRFTQSYYTASFSPPSEPEGVFDASVTAAAAAPYMGASNPPTYVGSVTYGRMLFVKVESDEAENDVKAAIEATFNAGTVSGDVSLSARYKEIMSRATVTVFALGGSPNDAIEIMTSGSDRAAKLKAYFDKGANYSAESPGVPIAYTVRSLRDNSAVKVASTLDYSVPECAPQPSTVKVTIDGIDVIDNNTWIGNTTVGYKVWINGTLAVQGQRSGVGDNSWVGIGEQRVLTVDKKNGSTVNVKAELTETDMSISPERTHTFYVDSATRTGQWTQLGPNAVEQGADSWRARLRYTISAN